MTEANPQPDLGAVRDAIASGDPVRAMPALTQLRFCDAVDATGVKVNGYLFRGHKGLILFAQTGLGFGENAFKVLGTQSL